MNNGPDKRDDRLVSPPTNVDVEIQQAFDQVLQGADRDRLKALLDKAKSEADDTDDEAKSA